MELVLVCRKCNIEKPHKEYSLTGRTKTPRRVCKACLALKMREERKINPDKFREQEYKKKYRITLEQYNKKLSEQNGVCAICKGTWCRVLVVDHDHDCCAGEITCGKCLRSLLCGSCNAGLGWFKNDVEIMKNAIEYLQTVKPGPYQ